MEVWHFDPLDIELGDLDVFEEITGADFSEVMQSGATGSKQMRAIYYLVARQNDPEFTVDQLAKVKLRQLTDVVDQFKVMQPDPTAPGADAS